MMGVRAKFACTAENTRNVGAGIEPIRTYEFVAVVDMDGGNNWYGTLNPGGTLTIPVIDPEVAFKPGELYYVDFTAVKQVELDQVAPEGLDDGPKPSRP